MGHPRHSHQVDQAPPLTAARSSLPTRSSGDLVGWGGDGQVGMGVGGCGCRWRVEVVRAIRTGQLHALPRFHPEPIYLVVYKGSLGALRLGIHDLEVSFPLRCFQRLSVPDIATRRCHWHDNRNTSGPSTQVLSYYRQTLSSILRPRQIGTELSHDVLNPARVPL